MWSLIALFAVVIVAMFLYDLAKEKRTVNLMEKYPILIGYLQEQGFVLEKVKNLEIVLSTRPSLMGRIHMTLVYSFGILRIEWVLINAVTTKKLKWEFKEGVTEKVIAHKINDDVRDYMIQAEREK